MAKKYTFMIFSSESVGKVRTLSISHRAIVAAFVAVTLLVAGVGFSAYKMISYKTAQSALMIDDDSYRITKNIDIHDQIALYNSKIQEITEKINMLDDLEYKIRDLVLMQEGNTPLKPVAIGGREVDLLREYSSAASLSEKDFFANLDATLQQLSFEVTQRELSLSELTSTLEEKRLVLLYTPTIWPVHGWLSSNFGYRLSPFTGRQTFHEGIDIAARNNTDVAATANGIVVFAGPKSGYGYMVTVDHGYGYMTRYGHNSVLSVKVGDKVERGQIIAKVGSTGQSTGPHLHYEILVNGIPVNPLKFIIEEETL